MSASIIHKLLLPLLLQTGTRNSRTHSHTNSQPENGDVLRVNRGLYSHFGVYVKDCSHVIHYTGANGPNDFNGIVRETSFAEFLNGAQSCDVCHFPEKPQALASTVPGNHKLFMLWQAVKNLKLKDYHLYSGDEAVMRARSKLGQGGYNLAFNNCEHFAVWCRTGVKDSSQVNQILDLITYMLG